MPIVTPGRRSDRPLLIRGAGVITMDPVVGDLERGDILVRDGVIAALGPDLVVDDAEVLEAGAMIAMPGFVDGHRHLWEGVIRNTLPTEDLGGYFARVNQGFAPAYSPEAAYLGTLVSALGALEAGITTVFDWSHIQTTPEHTDATLLALRESGLRATFGFGMPAVEDRGHRWPDDLLRLQREEFSSSDQKLTLALASLSPEHVPDAVARAHFRLAREAGLIISVHSGLEGMGEPGQIARFGREGLLGPDVNLVHCNSLSPVEWALIADTGTSVCITPSTEMQMGQGVPPIRQALEVGVRPSLGVDVETSVPGDMWTQMRVLYAHQRGEAFREIHAGRAAPPMLAPRDVLDYATLSGARSMRLDHKTGSLTVGKQADIVLLRADRLNVMPVNDMVTAVVLNMDARNVDTVLVAGDIVKRNGQMVGVDMASLSARLQACRETVFTTSGQPLPSPIWRH